MLLSSLLVFPAYGVASSTPMRNSIWDESGNDIETCDLTLDSNMVSFSPDSSNLITNFSSTPIPLSDNSITQEFSGYLTEEGQYQYLLVTLYEGQILQSTLSCPSNPDLDYDLWLCSVADDGTLNRISQGSLGTYIDPNTGKTVDESFSFVHESADSASYAVIVISTLGSSATEEFHLTVSIDTAGSYDAYEPNDNPFTATPVYLPTMSSRNQEVDANLNVVNDQDWYQINIDSEAVFNFSAGNYVVEPFYATTGNKMVLAPKVGDNYSLPAGTYYIRVSSGVSANDFQYGDYTLSISEVSQYTSIETAFDFGDWDNILSPIPNTIPVGQSTAYYKFNIDTLDKVYVYVSVREQSGEQLLEALDENGNLLNYAYTGNADDVVHTQLGYDKLVMNVDGTQGDTIYIRVTRADPTNYLNSMTPTIANRLQRGGGTYSIRGAATNEGFGYSSVIYCDLTSEDSIPKTAVVDEIKTTSQIYPSVQGVTHLLNPGGLGWIEPVSSSPTSCRFDFGLEYQIPVRNQWQFMYYQSAGATTEMTAIEMDITWYADISENNYELWDVSYQ